MARFSSKNSDFSSVLETSWSRSESERTRSTTRPSRVEVERIIVPLAEIKTAGVIIAVRTVSDDDRPSISNRIYSATARDSKRIESACQKPDRQGGLVRQQRPRLRAGFRHVLLRRKPFR